MSDRGRFCFIGRVAVEQSAPDFDGVHTGIDFLKTAYGAEASRRCSIQKARRTQQILRRTTEGLFANGSQACSSWQISAL